jgi:hypothetical protein
MHEGEELLDVEVGRDHTKHGPAVEAAGPRR